MQFLDTDNPHNTKTKMLNTTKTIIISSSINKNILRILRVQGSIMRTAACLGQVVKEEFTLIYTEIEGQFNIWAERMFQSQLSQQMVGQLSLGSRFNSG